MFADVNPRVRGDLMDTVCFNRAVEEQFGIDVTTLYALDMMDTEITIKVAAFENHDPEWVAAYQKELSHRIPLPHSFAEWSLRRRQYYLAKVLRRLLNYKP